MGRRLPRKPRCGMSPSPDSPGQTVACFARDVLLFGLCALIPRSDWFRLTSGRSLKIKDLEQVLMRHRIYPMSKYRKTLATISAPALMAGSLGTTCALARRFEQPPMRLTQGIDS